MKIPENIQKEANIGNIKCKSFVLIRVQIINILIGRLKRKILVLDNNFELLTLNLKFLNFFNFSIEATTTKLPIKVGFNNYSWIKNKSF